jgi:hypothetical protein
MTNASSTPGTAAKIDDLLGSALAVATVIQVAWPNRVHRRKHASDLRPRDALNGDGDGQVPVEDASGIGHWRWKAMFRATWPLGTKNSTPSPASSVRPWINFSLARDGLIPTG